jgi:hypothetical protein
MIMAIWPYYNTLFSTFQAFTVVYLALNPFMLGIFTVNMEEEIMGYPLFCQC